MEQRTFRRIIQDKLLWKNVHNLARRRISVKYISIYCQQYSNNMGCWFIAFGSILNAAYWELTMVRPLNDGLFLKYNFQVFVSQPFYKHSLSSSRLRCFAEKWKGKKYQSVIKWFRSMWHDILNPEND